MAFVILTAAEPHQMFLSDVSWQTGGVFGLLGKLILTSPQCGGMYGGTGHVVRARKDKAPRSVKIVGISSSVIKKSHLTSRLNRAVAFCEERAVP